MLALIFAVCLMLLGSHVWSAVGILLDRRHADAHTSARAARSSAKAAAFLATYNAGTQR